MSKDQQAPLQQIDVIKIYEKKHCLIIDDLTEVRSAYKRMLRSFGSKNIDTAATGDEAMKMVEAREYGMIICDYNLDESKDGQQILEELRHMNLLKYTTLFIIITAETSREMVLGAIENQPDDYVTKPLSQKMMRTRLDRALLKHEELYQIKSAMDNKNYDRAIRLCNEKIKEKSRYIWDCIRYKAQIYWLMEDIEAAQAIYTSVLKQKECNWAKIGLVKTLIENDTYDDIEKILKSIISDDHRYIEAHDILSEYYEKTEQYDKAQQSIRTATELSPKSILRHRRLAKLAEENQDDETCLKAYEEAIRWNYNSCHADAEDYFSLARKTVGVVKERKDKDAAEKTKKALNLLDRMIRRFPNNKNKVKSGFIESQLHASQGKTHLAQLSLELAEKEYGQLELKDTDTRLDFAQAHMMTGDKKKAYKELHLVYQNNQNDKNIQNKVDKISEEPISIAGKKCAAELSRLGIEAYQRKEYDKSLTIFKDALKMFPNHTGVNLNMVQVSLAKAEMDGKNEALFKLSKECLFRVDDIPEDHKQYERFRYLFNQYNNIYEDYISGKMAV